MSTKKTTNTEDILLNIQHLDFEENGQTFDILSKTEAAEMVENMKSLYELIENNTGKGLSDDEKNKLYSDASGTWNKIQSQLTSTMFNLYLNRPEFKYLTDLIYNKLPYNPDQLFFALAAEEVLEQTKLAAGGYKNDSDLISYPMTSKDITLIFHLINQHIVKGTRQSGSRTFASLITRIGKVSRAWGYFDKETKSLSEKMNTWVMTFTELDTSIPNVPTNSIAE